jgi:4-hydroxybenzoate polyprenyltransferase
VIWVKNQSKVKKDGWYMTICFKEFAALTKASYRTMRFSSVLCFTSATFAGAILAGSLSGLGIVWLLLFSASSTTFGFVINDLSDAELDRSAGVLRNSVSTGELSSGKCVLLTLFFLSISLASLTFLSLQNQLLGLVVIFLYFTYSWLVRAKARPVLDILYHGLCLAILATMGYLGYRPFNFACLLIASLVFLLSSTSQILQEIRDYETDVKMVKTTVTLLGKKLSLIICLAFLVFSFAIFILLLFYGVIPLGILLLSPLSYFIVAPFIRTIRNEEYESSMLRKIKETRLILIAILLAFLILS